MVGDCAMGLYFHTFVLLRLFHKTNNRQAKWFPKYLYNIKFRDEIISFIVQIPCAPLPPAILCYILFTIVILSMLQNISQLMSCKSPFAVVKMLQVKIAANPKPHELQMTSVHFPTPNLFLGSASTLKLCVRIFVNEMSFADLNECGLKPRPCEHRCMNTHGSYKCYCLNGYMLMPDGSCSSKLYKQ